MTMGFRFSKERWLGPAEGYAPSPSFWSPAALKAPCPLDETIRLARKLPSLSDRQEQQLRFAQARPWDHALQVRVQACLMEQDDELFVPPPAEDARSIQDPDKLASKAVLFIPLGLQLPNETTDLLQERFIYRSNTGALRVYVSKALISTHSLQVAQSGWGKTVTAHFQFANTRRQGRWAFIHSKAEEWLPLIPTLLAQGAQPAMPRQFRVNPIAPFGNPTKSREHFVQLFGSVEQVPIYSLDVLDEALGQVLQRFEAFTKPLPLDVNPTLADLIAALERIDSKHVSRTVVQTLLVRLKAWQRQFGDWARPWNPEALARRTIIWPMSELNEKSSRILVERLQGPLFAIRETRPTKEQTLLLHEEGRLVYCGPSQMAEDLALLRAEGLMVACVVQSTRDLNPVLLENTGIKSLGPVGHPAIARQMSTAMGLRQEHLDALVQQPVGTFIERYMYGRAGPILTRCPCLQLRLPTPQELHDAEYALDDLPVATREEAHRIELRDTNVETPGASAPLSDECIAFLQSVDEHPYLSTTERFRHNGMSAGRGNELKQQCVQHGLIEERRVPLGLGGSPVLLQLTIGAQQRLGLAEINHQVVHGYAMHLTCDHCERFGADVQHERDGVDLLLDVDGQSIAVEIEVSGTNVEANLQRNRDYDRIIFVAVGQTVLKRIRRKLTPTIRQLGLSDRVSLLTLGRAVKSDRPIWEIA